MSADYEGPGECPGCGRQVDRLEDVCPHCGYEPDPPLATVVQQLTERRKVGLPKIGPPPVIERVCAQCGAPFAQFQSFCPNCGLQKLPAKQNNGCAISGLILLLFLLAISSSCAIATGPYGGGADQVGWFFMICSLIGIALILFRWLRPPDQGK